MNKSRTPELLLVENIELWNVSGVNKQCSVLIKGGIVVEIGQGSIQAEHAKIINGKGKVLMPSGVDAHVHLRVPGQTHKESPETGLAAAAKGGYGAVLNMPNTSPPVDRRSVCEMAMNELKPAILDTGIEVFLSGCITKEMKGEELVNVDELAEWGVKTFTDDGLGVESDLLMEEIFRKASKWNIPVSQHAEFKGHGGILSGGKTQQENGIPLYPPTAEYNMVARDLKALQKCKDARYHVLHISLARSVELLEEAAKSGLNVSCEVTPHHLYYTFNDIPVDNTSFKMNPPLRDDADKRAMRRALNSGKIAFVATDHAPHGAHEKGCNFHTAAFGTTGMETSLLVLLDLLNKKEIDEKRLVDVFSLAPAKYLSIDDRFGKIEKGRKFNAVIFDKDFAPHKIQNSDLASKSHNNIFLGAELPGKILWYFNPTSTYDFS